MSALMGKNQSTIKPMFLESGKYGQTNQKNKFQYKGSFLNALNKEIVKGRIFVSSSFSSY